MSDGEVQGGQSLDDALNRRIVRGSAWVGVGFGGARLLSFASTLVLVRLLEPEAFGIVAVGLALLAVIAQIQESGLGAALVHSRRYDPRVAASTVFVFAALAGLALTVLTIILAPLYTRLLNIPEATIYVQVLAGLLAIRGVSVVPAALLERELDFRSRTIAELSGGISQVVVAISCAAGGLGAWSLVAGQLAASSVQMVIFWARASWRPSTLGASRTVLRDLIRYGRFVSGTNIMVIVNKNLDTAVVARFLGAGPVGVYNVAWRLAELPNTFVGLIVGRVMFSVYARLQHDLGAVRAAYLQNIQRTMLFALPVTATLGLAAEPIVLGLLGLAWEEAIDPLRLLAVFGALRLLAAPSGELFKGIGRPQLTLASTTVFGIAAFPALLVLVPALGTTGAALAMVLGISLSGSVALGLTFLILELRPAELAAALVRPAACASLVGLGVLAILPVTETVGPLAALGMVAVTATATFAASLALLARPLLTPIWAALRRT
jgi:lipopolysaccharide exporter